jgi:hypothetical protein
LPHTRMQVVADTTSAILAGGAVTTHYWLPLVREGSEWIGALLPYFGFVLVILQIVYWWRRIRRRSL